MSLKSVEVPELPLDSLLESSSVAVQETIATPQQIFAPDKMQAFKTNMQVALDSFGTDLPTELQGLSSQLELSNSKLADVLSASGYSAVDIDSFDFSIESLSGMSTSITSFDNAAAGGCEVLLNASRQITDLTELSLDDMDIAGATANFIGGVEKKISSLVSAASQSAASIADDLIGSANDLASGISSQLTSLSEINPGDVLKSVEDSAAGFLASVGGALNSLKSGIESIDVDDMFNITSGCAAATKANIQTQAKNVKNNIGKLKADATTGNLDKEIADLADSFQSAKASEDVFKITAGSISEESLAPIRNDLTKAVEVAEQFTTDKNIQSALTQTVSSAKQIAESHQDAPTTALNNLHKTQIIQANKKRDEQIEAALAQAKAKLNKVPEEMAKLANASRLRSATPAQAGREIVERREVLKVVPTATVIKPAQFNPSNYRSSTARHLNSVNSSVRASFASAIEKFIEDYYASGFDIRVTSSLRSMDKQRSLYKKLKPLGRRVAFPGNSWHNYGMAIDVEVFKDGSPLAGDNAVYMGILRQTFAQFNLTNPFDGDRIHFQPTQIAPSPENIKNGLLVAGKVNTKAVSALVG